jgi:[protein-PII] uridylyltransferase
VRGPAFGRAYAALVDDWLVSLAPERDKFAVVAVGGYGRRELAPTSDLDVLLLHDRRRDIAEIANGLWYPIWDAGFRLDHSVRTVPEALNVADHDLKAALGLLDARYVAGDEQLASRLVEQAGSQWSRHLERWLAVLEEGIDERHGRFGPVAFVLEPDLKEGPGGLRDATVVRALAAASPVVTLGPPFDDALSTLLDVRFGLQRSSGRHDDRLLLECQDGVAELLGHPSADDLMRNVAAAARTIRWHLSDSLRAIRATIAGPRGRGVTGADVALGPGIVLRDGEIAITADAVPAADPGVVLSVAAHAAYDGFPIARATLARLDDEAAILDTRWTDDQRAALVGLLDAGEPSIDVFETLDQYNLVTRVLPEWRTVRNRPQRNAFHKYTVDRHLVECSARAARLSRQVARPDLLVVAAWLHDLGKGSPGDHTEAGVELMRTIATRMGFELTDVDTLVELVRLHLLLPTIATSRDLDDPATIEAVAEAVGSVEVLELLHALTEADSRATGDTAWSPWKARLVQSLVERVETVLGGERRWVRPPPPATDVELAARAAGDLLVEGGDRSLIIAAPDQPRLFSRVVGVLGLSGQDVRGARARSTDDGVAISEFEFEPAFGEPPDWARFEADLRKAMRGRIAIDARLSERAARYARLHRPSAAAAPETRVIVDNDASPDATFFEVRTADRIGVLYGITRTFADLQLDIRHAKVATMGHEVVDSFYLVTEDGEKLLDPELVAELTTAIRFTLDRLV